MTAEKTPTDGLREGIAAGIGAWIPFGALFIYWGEYLAAIEVLVALTLILGLYRSIDVVDKYGVKS